MKTIFSIVLLFSFFIIHAQTNLDLSIKKGSSQTILLNEKEIRLSNCCLNGVQYKVEWDIVQNITPYFKITDVTLQSADSCSQEVKKVKADILNSKSEADIKKYVDQAKELINTIADSKCIAGLKAIISQTENVIKIPYTPLKNNQVITLTVTKIDQKGNQVGDSKWTFILKTPEKSRWLVHYGLTYTPSIISKTNHYYSLADTSVANKFTITKENNNGPKPWENISATINFTYPFHADSKDVDLGFTAGFGLSAGLELSGQAGLSMIIGDNVILGSGIVMMQKYKLRGRYSNGQIIKDNQDFSGLHEKVWLPELFFTLGFRFGNNPFAKKAAEPAATPAATPVVPTQP
ncbi:MAG: hypothetical protein ABIW47_15055 [Ginsengibacter sp.]